MNDDGVASTATDTGLPLARIRDVKFIGITLQGVSLGIVKIETDQPGLYGYGCASMTLRALAVRTSVEEFLRPFLIGRDVDQIEDIWQSSYMSSVYRSGPVLNNSLSGVDQALWDIKGRRANMPVYQLLGGKCRNAADVYVHAGGSTPEETADEVLRFMEEGYRNVRIQSSGEEVLKTTASVEGSWLFEPRPYMRAIVKVCDTVRKRCGEEINLLHDIHEVVPPAEAVVLCKQLEPYNLFFVEDPLPAEEIGHFEILRQQCSTPIAVGEKFHSPHEWVPLITGRLIDYIRVHISLVGGLSVARKIATLGEQFAVKTAWHGPADVSPVGHAANVALDLACHNFGIQERTAFNEQMLDIFPGTPETRDGYLWANEAPGWGIEVNGDLASKYPLTAEVPEMFGNMRRLDGSVMRW